MGTYPNANVCIFGKAIHANGENNDVDIVNLFCLHFMMKYLSGERIYWVCIFEKLKAIFCKHYQKVQMDEQMYMALRVIK